MSRIMVVDDDPLIRQLLSYQLADAGYQVSTAQSGQDALERLLHDQPDLVLLDVVMPGMNGWDVCNQIRSCCNVPVIMLTARSGEQDVVSGFGAGADDYISKPFSLPQLLARIEAVLRRSRYATVPASQHVANPSSVRSASLPHAGVGVASLPPLTLPQPTAAQANRHAEMKRVSLTAVGKKFAEARRQRGVTLYEAEVGCGIRKEYLQAVEHEQFDAIPREQLSTVLKVYSGFLGVDLRALLKQATVRPLPPIWPLYLVIFMTITLILAILVTMPPF
jgi:DNA-binding response OmpR family regulator